MLPVVFGRNKLSNQAGCDSNTPSFGGFHKWGYPQIIHFNGVFLINHPAIGGPPMTSWKASFLEFLGDNLDIYSCNEADFLFFGKKIWPMSIHKFQFVAFAAGVYRLHRLKFLNEFFVPMFINIPLEIVSMFDKKSPFCCGFISP